MRRAFQFVLGVLIFGIYTPLYILPRSRRGQLSRWIIRLLATIPFYYYEETKKVAGADISGLDDLQGYVDRVMSRKHRWHLRHTQRLVDTSCVTSCLVEQIPWRDRVLCLASYQEKLGKYNNKPHVDAWFLAQFIFLLMHVRPVITYRAYERLIGLRFVVLINKVACALDWVFLEGRLPGDVSVVTLKKDAVIKGIELAISQRARFFYCGPTNMEMKRSLGLGTYEMRELYCPKNTRVPFVKNVRFSPFAGADSGRSTT